MPIYALCDANNFYVSAERIFRPDLEGKPCLVLSNNDGCAIARSAEVKALGIKMGTPRFQIEDLIQQHGIVTMSSNYTLYADISARFMTTLESLAPETFVYSIDEAFLNLTGMQRTHDLVSYGRKIKSTVQQHVGLPICVGISTTKTLSKLANHAAKQYKATGGVVDLTEPARQRRLMKLVEVGEIWGVGRRIGKRLNEMGIDTALDLAQANPKWIRKHFSVVLERTHQELNGIACIPFDDNPAHQKQIVVSRSFGARVTELAEIKNAVTTFLTRAMEKLRKGQQKAALLQVFIRTSAFSKHEPQYANSQTYRFTTPTNDTRIAINGAMKLVKKLWKPGYAYAKAGVMLTDLYPDSIAQHTLFDWLDTSEESAALMGVIDKINTSGLGKVTLARQAESASWAMKSEHLSPCYTTRWSDLPRVK